MNHSSRAVTFVNYQDLYYHLRQDSTYPDEAILNLIGAVRGYLGGREQIRTISCTAYGDFESLPNGAQLQKNLFQRGITPSFVPASTVDLQLCIDTLEALNHSPCTLDTVVLISAGQDYLPLIQHIQRYGHRVVLVAFRDTPASTLTQESREHLFLDANILLKTAATRRPSREPADYQPGGFKKPEALPYAMDKAALETIELFFGHYKEIYLSPLLRKLSDELGDTNGYEPKTLIGSLEDKGAIRLEKRRGVEHDYTVLIVNQEHPEVIAIREQNTRDGFAARRHETEEVPWDADHIEPDWEANDDYGDETGD